MKYQLKLDYTENELKELKELGETYNDPMYAISRLLNAETRGFGSLQAKYMTMEHTKEFDFMTDINNVVMGTAIFPDKLYIIHDTNTNCVIYHDYINNKLDWGPLTFYSPVKNTKEDWLAINPAYESMLEVFD